MLGDGVSVLAAASRCVTEAYGEPGKLTGQHEVNSPECMQAW
jgi:hypothetical protein